MIEIPNEVFNCQAKFWNTTITSGVFGDKSSAQHVDLGIVSGRFINKQNVTYNNLAKSVTDNTVFYFNGYLDNLKLGSFVAFYSINDISQRYNDFDYVVTKIEPAIENDTINFTKVTVSERKKNEL